MILSCSNKTLLPLQGGRGGGGGGGGGTWNKET